MQIKIKKKNKDGIVRLESNGEIREFIEQQDFLQKDNSKLLICFKGKDSSGIVELSEKDIKKLAEELEFRKNNLQNQKIMKFEK